MDPLPSPFSSSPDSPFFHGLPSFSALRDVGSCLRADDLGGPVVPPEHVSFPYLKPVWAFVQEIGRFFYPFPLWKPGTFTQVPGVPSEGSKLSPYLASRLLTRSSLYSGPPCSFVRLVQRGGRRPELRLPYYRYMLPYLSSTVRLRTRTHCCAYGKWVLRLRSLPDRPNRWAKFFLPRSPVGFNRAPNARHCSSVLRTSRTGPSVTASFPSLGPVPPPLLLLLPFEVSSRASLRGSHRTFFWGGAGFICYCARLVQFPFRIIMHLKSFFSI